MIIKLLCINTTDLYDYDGDKILTINEGDIVNAFVDRYGVHFEYEPNCYTAPYRYEDVEKDFISALDEDSYNKIYKKVQNCKVFIDGIEVGIAEDATLKWKG